MRLSGILITAAIGCCLPVGCTRGEPARPRAGASASPEVAGTRGEPVRVATADAVHGNDAGTRAEAKAAVPGTDVPVNANAAGNAAGLTLLSGGPVRAERAEVKLQRMGPPWTRVQERAELPARHGALTLAVPDALESEVNPEEASSPQSWGVRALTVEIDGRPAPVRHVVYPEEEPHGLDGAYVFEVPPGARQVEARYQFASMAPSDHSQEWSWDGRALQSWGTPPAELRLEWSGLGDLPATQLALHFEGAAIPAWSFSGGTLSFCLQGNVPPRLGVEVPDAPCGFPLCGSEKTGGTCVDATQVFSCAGVLSEGGGLESWTKAATAGCYDARSLALSRNWLFARRGQTFKTPWLRDYFQHQPWYRPRPGTQVAESALEPEERKLLEVLKRLEGAVEKRPACRTGCAR